MVKKAPPELVVPLCFGTAAIPGLSTASDRCNNLRGPRFPRLTRYRAKLESITYILWGDLIRLRDLGLHCAKTGNTRAGVKRVLLPFLLLAGCQTQKRQLPPEPGRPDTTLRTTQRSALTPGETIVATGKLLEILWDYPADQMQLVTFWVYASTDGASWSPVTNIENRLSCVLPANQAYRFFSVSASNAGGQAWCGGRTVVNQ